MNKEKYIDKFRTAFPDQDGAVYELAWYFHSMTKAKYYMALLETCNTNADIAWKAMRLMYVSGDINEIQAMSRKFINALLPFTTLDKKGKANSIAYHVKAMLDDDSVQKERKDNLARLKPAAEATSRSVQPDQVDFPKISEGDIIVIIPGSRTHELSQYLQNLVKKGQAQVIQVQGSDNEMEVSEGNTPCASARSIAFRVNEQSKARVLALARTHIQLGIPPRQNVMQALVAKHIRMKKGGSRNIVRLKDVSNLKSKMTARAVVPPLLKQTGIAHTAIQSLLPTLGIASPAVVSPAFPDKDKLKMLCRHKDVTIWEVK